MSIEQETDAHFNARLAHASADERDAVLAELAARAVTGDELAARTIQRLVLPACQRIAAGRGGDLLTALVQAAYDEVIDWAVREGHVTR